MQKDRGEGRRGSTLLETVIAFFVIAGAAAVVTGFFASTTSTQKAELFDGSGLIDDIQLPFSVQYGTGYGNLVEQPDGFRAVFTNG